MQLHVYISILLFKAIIIRFTMSEETLGTKNLASKTQISVTDVIYGPINAMKGKLLFSCLASPKVIKTS